MVRYHAHLVGAWLISLGGPYRNQTNSLKHSPCYFSSICRESSAHIAQEVCTDQGNRRLTPVRLCETYAMTDGVE